MPQISLYIDETTLKKVEAEARREQMSISGWVAEQIRTKIDPKLPEDFDKLYGSLGTDFVRQEPLSLADDATREEL